MGMTNVWLLVYNSLYGKKIAIIEVIMKTYTYKENNDNYVTITEKEIIEEYYSDRVGDITEENFIKLFIELNKAEEIKV
jgi:hypothetical protein